MKMVQDIVTEYQVSNPPRWIRARKAHPCEICGHVIPVQALYYAQTVYPGEWGNDNEDITTFRAHGDCYVVWAAVGQRYKDQCGLNDDDPWDPNDWNEWLAAQGVQNPYPPEREGGPADGQA